MGTRGGPQRFECTAGSSVYCESVINFIKKFVLLVVPPPKIWKSRLSFQVWLPLQSPILVDPVSARSWMQLQSPKLCTAVCSCNCRATITTRVALLILTTYYWATTYLKRCAILNLIKRAKQSVARLQILVSTAVWKARTFPNPSSPGGRELRASALQHRTKSLRARKLLPGGDPRSRGGLVGITTN